MKKIFSLLLVGLFLGIAPAFSAQQGHVTTSRHVQPHHATHITHHRPVPHHHRYYPPRPPRPYIGFYRSYYNPYYYTPYYTPYYQTTYVVTPTSAGETVIVGDPYAAVNTTANVLNTAANVAATIKYLSW